MNTGRAEGTAVARDAADADAIAAAVLACPAVADLSGGTVGEVATYLPGRRVKGVRVREDRIDIQVVGVYGVPIPDLAQQVRAAVARPARRRAVNVRVEDLRTAEESAHAALTRP